MIGIIVVAHGNLAQAFCEVALSLTSDKANVLRPFSVDLIKPVNHQQQNLIDIVNEIDQGKGVILLTDLFGGTPSNLAISLLQLAPVEVVAGINLPMLVKLLSLPDNIDRKKAAELAQEAGRKYIQNAEAALRS